IWFGSSAGVAISSKFQESRSVFLWIKSGWHIIVAYILGFFILLFFMGWEPQIIPSKSHVPKIEEQNSPPPLLPPVVPHQ
ncbi:MAG TPA: hypothetical protein DCL77_06140, partial [Prolixibacteraceae bacterium]|nr:hypothetical protein [Prolixibacteraceae bacterium]